MRRYYSLLRLLFYVVTNKIINNTSVLHVAMFLLMEAFPPAVQGMDHSLNRYEFSDVPRKICHYSINVPILSFLSDPQVSHDIFTGSDIFTSSSHLITIVELIQNFTFLIFGYIYFFSIMQAIKSRFYFVTKRNDIYILLSDSTSVHGKFPDDNHAANIYCNLIDILALHGCQ